MCLQSDLLTLYGFTVLLTIFWLIHVYSLTSVYNLFTISLICFQSDLDYPHMPRQARELTEQDLQASLQGLLHCLPWKMLFVACLMSQQNMLLYLRDESAQSESTSDWFSYCSSCGWHWKNLSLVCGLLFLFQPCCSSPALSSLSLSLFCSSIIPVTADGEETCP